MMNSRKNEKQLLEIYIFWYGHPQKLIENLAKKQIKNVEFLESHLENIWKNIWFAKNEEQKIIDEYLKKYEFLFSEDLDSFRNRNFFMDFALIILYDQISRNIFRNSKTAYFYDKKSREIAEKYKEYLHELPLHNILTILICFLHSENIEDQLFVKEQIVCLRNRYKMQFSEIIDHLALIHNNHYERIKMFGRIPERNKYLGRINTEAENIYIKTVDFSKV